METIVSTVVLTKAQRLDSVLATRYSVTVSTCLRKVEAGTDHRATIVSCIGIEMIV